jgi:hypothetical protein
MAKKVKAILHHLSGSGYTACGVDTFFWEKVELKAKTRKTWAAVAKSEYGCKRCLAVKAKMDAAKASGSEGKKTAKKKMKAGCGCG